MQSVIEVTEEGVVAAGATGVAVTLYSLFEEEGEVKVDRPFYYFVVKEQTGVLFSGTVADPTG